VTDPISFPSPITSDPISFQEGNGKDMDQAAGRNRLKDIGSV
jgi:hypothetical protein